ncbi:MAG: DegT/DnrJ/EryC1/StrS family aminotransferase [Bryobacter sp.]|nr:DegT/DnrJ/EryC1/StrS family aminotransferase [Bryobacter sp. CoA8 C33]
MILLNDFRRQWADTGGAAMDAMAKVGASGWYVLGEQVKRFEQDLAHWWGVEQAIGVANGLDAIELALKALGCGPGDFVLTSPISAFATPLAITKLGAQPVFCDADESGQVDLAACRRTLEQRPEIRYFVPVHLFGQCLDLDELDRLRDDFQLGLVEDCAQSIGARFLGRPCGTAGQYAATSFYPTKNLGAMGDGGAVLTNSEAAALPVRQLRDYGQTAKYRHDLLGYNSRLDELQAAILAHAYLPWLTQWTLRRRAIAAEYLTGITNPAIRCVPVPPGSEGVWHLFPVLVQPHRKEAAMAHFKAAEVATGEHYPLALVEQKALAHLAGKWGSGCARAQHFCHAEISLPIHPYLTDAEVRQVIDAANGWQG